jgi:hypothetical protein
MCGHKGPGAGGLAILEIHHIDREPDDVDEHDPDNLTTLCRACHSWHHQQSFREDVPIELSDEDVSQLLSQDIEILRYLVEAGPARTGAIADAVTAELTVPAVRERLWVLAGLDNKLERRDQQLIDKDIETNEWGLPSQIENPARGHIPEDRQRLIQRVEDEQVRRALDRGCDRDMVTAVLGISKRSTFYKEKRARAFDLPLDAIAGRGRTADSTQSGRGRDEAAGSQQSDDVDGDTEVEMETWGTPAADGDGVAGEESAADEALAELAASIERAQEVIDEVGAED